MHFSRPEVQVWNAEPRSLRVSLRNAASNPNNYRFLAVAPAADIM
jgi:hypothetical protein